MTDTTTAPVTTTCDARVEIVVDGQRRSNYATLNEAQMRVRRGTA